MGRRVKPGDPKRAVGYVRVSTEDQRLGPDAQRTAIADWSARNGVFLTGFHSDLGRSGSLEIHKRPGLLAAVNALVPQGAGLLIVSNWDRLARSVGVALAVDELVRNSGATVVSADGTAQGDGPDGQLMRTIYLAFAEYERARIRLRTQKALAEHRAKGLAQGGDQPYGQRVGEGNRVEADPVELSTVALIRQLKAEGLSLRAIAAELDRRGVPVRGNRWHKTTIVRLLGRVYATQHEASSEGVHG